MLWQRAAFQHAICNVCELQVGFAAGAAAEAAALVERSRLRLRAVATLVAKERRPRVLSLESVDPLVIGEFVRVC